MTGQQVERRFLPRCADVKRPLALLATLALCAGVATAADGWRWSIPDWLPAPVVPEDNPMSQAKVDLGRHLFYDARLSADSTVACASCHDQARGFSDGRATAIGIGGAEGARNAPGLANVAYLPVLTWGNPLIGSLEQHALIPMFGTAPVEMGAAGREKALFAAIAADPYYATAFPVAFPDKGGEITLFTVTRALAAFQRTLISVGAPYDRYKYGGDATAMTPEALRGENLFFGEKLECYHCHGGFNFTDNLVTSRTRIVERAFHNTGLYDPIPPGSEGIATFTLRTEDIGRFRTPSLRNVAATGPYMHDGSIGSLSDVMDAYAKGGRFPDAVQKDPLVAGFSMTAQERADVIAFLESLTDQDFLNNPAFADPWPSQHPATKTRVMP